MIIESNIEEIKATKETVFAFVSNLSNLKELMPNEVTNWAAESEQCTFVLGGMANIGMKLIEKHPSDEIKIESFGKVPFNFKLSFLFKESASGSTVQLVFDGDVNMFMKPMVEKPLTNFFNFIAKQLRKKYENAA